MADVLVDRLLYGRHGRLVAQWDRRSRLPMLGFAVDPADPDAVVATTPQRPVGSDDGGRTGSPMGGPAARGRGDAGRRRGCRLQVAVGERGIVVSTDDGRTFATQYSKRS